MAGASSDSHFPKIGHRAPLLRQRPRDVVVIKVPKAMIRHMPFQWVRMQGLLETLETQVVTVKSPLLTQKLPSQIKQGTD